MSVASDDTAILYPVEKIVDKRSKKGKVEYRVRWKNYGPETDSWEPLKSLKDTCYPLIKDFNDTLRSIYHKSGVSNSSNNSLNLSQPINGKFFDMERHDSLISNSVKNKKMKPLKLSNPITNDNVDSSNSASHISNKTAFEHPVMPEDEESLAQVTNKGSRKMILYLEDNEIEEPSHQKSQNQKINGISTPKFSNFNHKIKSFTQMEKIKPVELKRKNFSSESESSKRQKLTNQDNILNNHKVDHNSNIISQINSKIIGHLNKSKKEKMKLIKCKKPLPYQRYMESENIESIEPLSTRGKSARQMGGANRFREIIFRKDTAAGFTEISLHNISHIYPNCLTIKILNELSTALKLAMSDSSRVLLLSSVGKVFSSGLDLRSIVHSPHNPITYFKNSKSSTAQLANPLSHNQYLHDLSESLKRFLLQLLNFPKPIVVAISGPAIGLGCAILPLCDLIYATESSSFYLPYSSLCQPPEGGTSVTLSMLIGMPAANQLLLGGRRWSAKDALNGGLISEIIFSDKFKAELFSRCKKLADVPSTSLESMKSMLRFHFKEKIEQAINVECKKLLDTWRTSEFQSSAQLFLDRHLPGLLS